MGADCQLLRIIGNGKVKGNIVLEQRGGNADEEPLGANARRAKVSLTISTIIRTILALSKRACLGRCLVRLPHADVPNDGSEILEAESSACTRCHSVFLFSTTVSIETTHIG